MKCLLLIAVFCVVPCAFQDVWDEYETWYDDFNNLEGDELIGKLANPDGNLADTPYKNKNEEGDDYNNYGDYEIEDNRDEIKPKLDKDQEVIQEQELEKNDESAIDDFDALQQIFNNDDVNEDVMDAILAVDEKSQIDLNNLLSDPSKDNKNMENNVDIGNEGIQQNIDDINKETQQILDNIDSDFNEDKIDDSDDSKVKNHANVELLPDDIQADMQDIIEETRQILEKTNKEFDETMNDTQEDILDESDQKEIMIEDSKAIVENLEELFPKTNIHSDIHSDLQTLEDKVIDETGINGAEDSVDKVYEDLNADLEKLFETWKKISEDDDSDEPNPVEESIGNDENNNKQAIPDEANADDAYGRDTVEIGDEVKEQNDFDYEGEARILATRQEFYDSILDEDLSKLFEEFEENNEDEKPANTDLEDTVPILYVNDALDAGSDENNQQDAKNKSDNLEENKEIVENTDEVAPKSEDIPANGEEKTTTITKDQDESTTPEISRQSSEEYSKPTKFVDELTSDESIDELTRQFVISHDSEIKTDGDETPIHISLTANEPVVITSPNYPDAYPTDITTIDWILEGLGTGIEVNITDLAINSAMGHYLMLKPGQSDASGDQGIVFAYRLNNERRYRFRDVNKMLVRFNPTGGMSFSRGFKLSARIIEAPVSDDETAQELPEPESLLPEPIESATVLLAGVNSTRFEDIREEFRRLLADMATMYINANDIDPGMNATSAVTQIIRTYVCNINWPAFDSCVSVTFGIPLVYEDNADRLNENELLDMWGTYSGRDPFAARLSSLGIREYDPPKDNYILTIWVVIGSAVLISTTMLAFVLWRYSCAENYTRMQEEGDTDSIQEKKRGLDMYPTPHQTLPPLYTENDYKWADGTFDDSTRVDMGGFANSTFARGELSDESDDEVVKRES